MENKDKYQADLLKNRLSKKYKLLRKWARNNSISCFRIYDNDIPEIPLAIDVYEFLEKNIASTGSATGKISVGESVEPTKTSKLYINKDSLIKLLKENNKKISENDQDAIKIASENRYALMFLYQRPYEKDDDEENAWLELMAEAVSEVLCIEKSHVVFKLRKKQTDGEKREQYEKDDDSCAIEGLTQENGAIFKINLGRYLDTGLFFDHRILRKKVMEEAKGKSVLNLFCYTGSFSVFAALGGASRVESVDLSNTYLSWAKENFELNGLIDSNGSRKETPKQVRGDIRQFGMTKDDGVMLNSFQHPSQYILTKADVMKFLETKTKERPTPENRYDIIILDPPTFSNSKSTENILDINRDWSTLVENCLKLLNPRGILYFSTNSKKLKFDDASLSRPACDLTAKSIDKDFEGKKPHRLWKFEK